MKKDEKTGRKQEKKQKQTKPKKKAEKEEEGKQKKAKQKQSTNPPPPKKIYNSSSSSNRSPPHYPLAPKSLRVILSQYLSFFCYLATPEYVAWLGAWRELATPTSTPACSVRG